MPKAIVYFNVAIEIEATDALMARMLDSSEEGMGPFYPSENRGQAWEKLARWVGLEKWQVSSLDGIADFPDDAADTRTLDIEMTDVQELP